MKKYCLLILLVVIILISSIVNAFNFTNLTQWKIEEGGNDHWYCVNTNMFAWTEAQNEASSTIHDGMSGYLTSITSEEENNFIFSTILYGVDDPMYSGQDQFLLGGYWNGNSWAWNSGENYSYTNWSIGEPNNPSETVISMWGEDADLSRPRYPGYWNDTINNLGLWSIVEWGDPSTANPVSTTDPVPEPSTFILMGFGFVGLVVISMKN